MLFPRLLIPCEPKNEDGHRIRRALRPALALIFLFLALRTPELSAQKPDAAQPSPTLLVQTDADCSFALDDGPGELLKAGPFKRSSITLGEHVVSCVSQDGKDRWRTVISADKPVQKVVLIELQKVRVAREKDEKEATQLERDIKAKREQAEKLKAATANATARQDAINSRKSQIQDQIAGVQKQIQQEQAAAQDDDANTQQARSCVASAPKTSVGVLIAAGCSAKATESDNSARAHRGNIVRLQNQISDLNREMARPDAGLNPEYAGPSTAQPAALQFGQPSGFSSMSSGVADIPSAPARQIPGNSRGIMLAVDMECIVSIDGKLVGRVQGNRRDFFPASLGKHTFSATTKDGDYWQRKIEIGSVPNPPLVISFQKERADRVAHEGNMSPLLKQGDAEQGPASTQRGKELASRELETARRGSIVEAANYYADQWGKELGMQQNRDKSSGSLDDAVSAQGIQNLGNTDTAAQTPNNLAMGIEILRSNHLKTKARKNELAAHSAEMQIDYLGKAMEEPLKYPPANDSKGYAAIARAVMRDKSEGKLITAPDSIEYQDPAGVKEHISCSSLTSASEGSHVHLQYTVDLAGDHKLQRKSLDARSVPESDQDLIMGNVYLACPKLTQ